MVWKSKSGDCFALDNRCPHEGYPLKEGTEDDNCVLTCNWHNWKFDLKTGRCILGADHVQTYATKIEEGFVWVDFCLHNKNQQATQTRTKKRSNR